MFVKGRVLLVVCVLRVFAFACIVAFGLSCSLLCFVLFVFALPILFCFVG